MENETNEIEKNYLFRVPKTDNSTMDVHLKHGQSLFVVGANGTGKSSIMNLFFGQYSDSCRRISAHRQTWFTSGSLTLSPAQKRDMENNIKHSDSNPQARWKDDYSAHRASVAIYDLINSENKRARSIANAVDTSQLERATLLSQKDSPIKILNELLKLSNISIQISIENNEDLVASRNSGEKYSIAELSDGERNALLIAANVLTVDPGTLILIDEPERHLHRSITSPLLTQLFSMRKDCSFVVSTHDITLVSDQNSSAILLVRDCMYEKSQVKSWDVDLLSADESVADQVKIDILGSRRKILFVEGVSKSLDQQLYTVIFPGVSVISKENCRAVQQSVLSARESKNLHWITAFGIIDRDNRNDKEIQSLKEKGIYAIRTYSVESIYYHPVVQKIIAERITKVAGGDTQTRISEAKISLIEAIKPHAKRLGEQAAERRIREKFFEHIPNGSKISEGNSVSIDIDVKTIVDEEIKKIENHIQTSDENFLISNYPVRETPALKEISIKLGFQGRQQYESAVIKMLTEDKNGLEKVREFFGTLYADLFSQ